MELLVGKDEAIDETLRDEMTEKIAADATTPADVKNFFILMGQICNNTDSISFEMRDMTQCFQFNVGDCVYSQAFDGGKIVVYTGAAENPTAIVAISPETLLAINTGSIHSSVAQMNGAITYTGPRHEMLRYQQIFELYLDEII